MKEKVPYLCVAAAAALWGVIGLFTHYLSAAGIPSGSLVAIRAVGAALTLSILFLIRDRSVFRIRLRDIKYFIGTGIVSFVLFNWCYFNCISECSLSVAAILLYTAPTFVVVLSAVLFRERITWLKGIALICTFLGCALVSGILGGAQQYSMKGILFGVASGLFYGLYSIFGRYALRRYSTYTVTLYTFLFAALGSLPLCEFHTIFNALQSGSLILSSVLLVFVSTVAPFLLYTKGMERVSSGNASIIATVEPVVAAVISFSVFGEAVTYVGAAGILIVIAAVILLACST